MCKKVSNKNTCNTRIDKCIKPFVKWLQFKHITVASCCGHGRYPLTIIVKEGINVKNNLSPTDRKNIIIYREIISQKIISRKRNFYIRDSKGYYYIPEVSVNKTKIKSLVF